MTTDMNTPNPARPEIERDPARMREKIAAARAAGRRVGFVPTMGALHAGHASLAARARAECDDVAVSIFVNPTQFAPHEDFGRYPRTLATDCQLLGEQGVRWVFAPEVAAMYLPGAATRVKVAPPSRLICTSPVMDAVADERTTTTSSPTTSALICAPAEPTSLTASTAQVSPLSSE